jgi:ribosomal protein L22
MTEREKKHTHETAPVADTSGASQPPTKHEAPEGKAPESTPSADLVKSEKPIETRTDTSVKSDATKPEKPAKASVKPVVKKELALVRAPNLPISKRQGMYLCAFMKGKRIDQVITELGEVINLKRAVPFKGEVPHRKGRGMMSGRYPVSASKLLIPIMKTLRGNIIANGMDLDKSRVTLASATWASRPMRRGGTHAKRTYLMIEAREVMKK